MNTNEKPPPEHRAPAPAGWNSMTDAPHDGRTVELLNDDYSIVKAFWGQRTHNGTLLFCWIREPDRHAYLAGDFSFIGWRNDRGPGA